MKEKCACQDNCNGFNPDLPEDCSECYLNNGDIEFYDQVPEEFEEAKVEPTCIYPRCGCPHFMC